MRDAHGTGTGTQFDRAYSLVASPPAGNGFEIGTNEDTPLRICFSIEKADCPEPNVARISIWNLSPQSIAILSRPDCKVALRAGYANTGMALIFVGEVTYVKTIMDTADRETVIEAIDGRVCLRDTYVALSYPPPASTRVIIEDVARQMGVALSLSHSAVFADMPGGFSFAGRATTALDKACANSGNTWQIQNGVLQVKQCRDTMNQQVYVLSPESGLVGIPKHILIGQDGIDTHEQPGREVTYLLNGAINVSDLVRLESKYAGGNFRVKRLAIDGDNYGGAWMCTAGLIYV